VLLHDKKKKAGEDGSATGGRQILGPAKKPAEKKTAEARGAKEKLFREGNG